MAVNPSADKSRENEKGSYNYLNNVSAHILWFFIADNKPDDYDKGNNTGGKVESQKAHVLFGLGFIILSFLEAIFARTRKVIVSATPTTNVDHGISGAAALGINTPITSEPKQSLLRPKGSWLKLTAYFLCSCHYGIKTRSTVSIII